MTDPVSHRGSLFLSYARHDDEAFVARLYEDLAAQGFTIWWDRRCMPNRGLTFLHEIRDAIAGAQRTVQYSDCREANLSKLHDACKLMCEG